MTTAEKFSMVIDSAADTVRKSHLIYVQVLKSYTQCPSKTEGEILVLDLLNQTHEVYMASIAAYIQAKVQRDIAFVEHGIGAEAFESKAGTN